MGKDWHLDKRSLYGHVFEDPTLADRWIACRCGVSLSRDGEATEQILQASDCAECD